MFHFLFSSQSSSFSSYFVFRIFSLLLVLTGVLSCLHQPDLACERFQQGTFQSQLYLNGHLETTTFIRDSIQEIDIFRNKTDTFAVRWINTCECLFTVKNPKTAQQKKAIHMRIISTDKDVYTYEYGLVGDVRKERGTAQKILSKKPSLF